VIQQGKEITLHKMDVVDNIDKSALSDLTRPLGRPGRLWVLEKS
jgi:hypothetical protein